MRSSFSCPSSIYLCTSNVVKFLYWGPGEPNRLVKGNPICVEMRFFDTENSWNDIPCTTENFWMCEKEAAL
uniref:C-type lectin domain-containing protein n=1 Tax=Xiphophorus couchianus TaxID=32473 RepID=A0A3B5M8L6_9TELE